MTWRGVPESRFALHCAASKSIFKDPSVAGVFVRFAAVSKYGLCDIFGTGGGEVVQSLRFSERLTGAHAKNSSWSDGRYTSLVRELVGELQCENTL